jgi:hypothetical protein
MNPVTELICSSDEYYSNLGKLEFLINYDKVLDVEIENIKAELQAEMENLASLQ